MQSRYTQRPRFPDACENCGHFCNNFEVWNPHCSADESFYCQLGKGKKRPRHKRKQIDPGFGTCSKWASLSDCKILTIDAATKLGKLKKICVFWNMTDISWYIVQNYRIYGLAWTSTRKVKHKPMNKIAFMEFIKGW